MNDLIEALQIFKKYTGDSAPIQCEEDTLSVCLDVKNVSEEDIVKLEVLGFLIDWSSRDFVSYRFGSC